jgi:signal transduction histidine kinase/CheY-like chemotaxis protein
MFSVLACIAVDHDLKLVVLAALVCATACAAAFGFHLRSLQAAGSTVRWVWAALTGVVAGSGVWATHFVAMLAYEPELPMGYEPWTTALSWLIAVLGMGAGFALPVHRDTRATALAGGALAGMAVGAMHFTGISAWRMQAQIEWNEAFIVAAMAVGLLGGAAAFYLRTRVARQWVVVAPAGLMVLAIVGLHFTAMTAVELAPDPALALPAQLAGRDTLAVATVVLVALILAATSGLIWMQALGRRSTLHGLRDALDAVPSGLAFYDPDGRLLSWNKAYAGLVAAAGVEVRHGLTRSEIAQAVFAAGWAPQAGHTVDAPLSDFYDRSRTQGVELELPDGRWIRHQAFSTQDGGGVTKISDITEQRETARVLSEARDAAEAANRAKSQFLANMSHEIRTPLNGVLGVADVLVASGLSAKQQELVGVIKTSGDLLNALLGDLLDLAQIEAGSAELRPQRTPLGSLVQSVCDLYAPQAEQMGLALRVEIGPGAGDPVSCDGVRLRQVLGNLASNAVKFTERGEAVIRLDRQGDRVTFQVRDTGVGFDAALKAELLGAFGQADDSSTRRYGGAGLGLAICREYVALMGGELDCESTPGQGSTFTFSLDLPALPDAGAAEPHAVAYAADEVERTFRVLIVDDNEINRQVMGLILDSAGIEHAEAENGLLGVEAAVTGGFDAILMDIQMPVMDGFEATRRIRAWEAEQGRQRMPILIVSANGLQEHVDEGARAGADGHLNKPVSVPQLLGALERHVGAVLAA